MRRPNWRMTSTVMPASSGRPGPGEITIRSGCIASTSPSVISSLRCTTGGMPQLAEVLGEVVGKRIVVVEQQDLHLELGLRHLDGLQERARLVARLLVFRRGVRVGDDAGAGLDAGDAVAHA